MDEEYFRIILEIIFKEYSTELFKSLISICDNNIDNSNNNSCNNINSSYKEIINNFSFYRFTKIDINHLKISSWNGENQDRIYKFIQFYVSLESQGIMNKSFDDTIIYNLFYTLTINYNNNNNISSHKDNYEKFISLITYSCSNNNNNRFSYIYPVVWNQLLDFNRINYKINQKGYIKLKNKEDINWLCEHFNYPIISNNFNNQLNKLKSSEKNQSNICLFKFATLELLNYGLEHLLLSLNFNFNFDNIFNANKSRILLIGHLYGIIYCKAIKECDVGTLQYIDQEYPYFKLDLDNNHKQLEKSFNDIKSNDNRSNLIKYLSSINFKSFSEPVLLKFIKSISTWSSIQSNRIEIEYSTLQREHILINCFFREMFKDLQLIQYLISININPIQQLDNNTFNNHFKKHYCNKIGSKYIVSDGFMHTNISSSSNNNIKSLIDGYLEIYKQLIDNNSKEYLDSNLNLQLVLNQLYNILIQHNSTQISTIKYYYNLINYKYQRKVIYQNQYHSYYYLLKIHSSIEMYLIALLQVYECCSFFNGKGYISLNPIIQFAQYFSSEKFTLEYLSNQTFDEVLEQVIESLVLQPIIQKLTSTIHEGGKISKFYKLSLNCNLVYFLEIRRLDLFFKHFNFIIKLLDFDVSLDELILNLYNNSCSILESISYPYIYLDFQFTIRRLHSNFSYKLFEDHQGPKYHPNVNGGFFFYITKETVKAIESSRLLLKYINKNINNINNN